MFLTATKISYNSQHCFTTQHIPFHNSYSFQTIIYPKFLIIRNKPNDQHLEKTQTTKVTSDHWVEAVLEMRHLPHSFLHKT